MHVLVGYASAHGSTAEIARRIAEVLQHQLLDRDVDVVAVPEVTDPDAYEAIVLGSAIHDQDWLPEATAFVRRHQDVLRAKPVWLFSVGMSAGLPAILRKPGRVAQDRRMARALRDTVRPRGHHLFSGAVRAEHFPPRSRALVRAIGVRFGDYRDAEEIEAWARQIAEELAANRSPASGSP